MSAMHAMNTWNHPSNITDLSAMTEIVADIVSFGLSKNDLSMSRRDLAQPGGHS